MLLGLASKHLLVTSRSYHIPFQQPNLWPRTKEILFLYIPRGNSSLAQFMFPGKFMSSKTALMPGQLKKKIGLQDSIKRLEI